MEKTRRSPDRHLDSLPEPVRGHMRQLDALISKEMPGRSRTVWEGVFWGGTQQHIIGYGDLSHERPGGRVDWFMVGLAAQKAHISIYVNAVDGGEYAVKRFADRLGKVKVGTSVINVKAIDDLDLDALAELVALANSQLED